MCIIKINKYIKGKEAGTCNTVTKVASVYDISVTVDRLGSRTFLPPCALNSFIHRSPFIILISHSISHFAMYLNIPCTAYVCMLFIITVTS